MIKQILDKYIDDEIEIILLDEPLIKEDDIQKFEKKIGFSLPLEFKEFCLSKYNTMTLEVKEDIWSRPDCGERGPAWTFSYGFDIHGFSNELDEDYHIPSLYDRLKNSNGSVKKAIPFMNISTEYEPFCFLENQTIWKYNYSDESPDEDDIFKVNFYKFFEYQVRALMYRKELYKKWKNGEDVSYSFEIDGYYL